MAINYEEDILKPTQLPPGRGVKTAEKFPTWKEDRLLAAVCGTRLVQVGV